MAFELSPRAAGQLKDQARQTRRLMRNSDAFTFGAGDAGQVTRAPNTQWLRVTSTSASSGYYPALILTNFNGTSFTDLDGTTQVWVTFPRGYTPTSTDVSGNTPFFGRQDADYNGQPAFAVINCPC